MRILIRDIGLLSVAEFVRVNRNVDDDPEDNAADLARDMEQLSLATPETGERIASKVRFDLDLPSAAEDDMPLGPGIPLPEWDYRKNAARASKVACASCWTLAARTPASPPKRAIKDLRRAGPTPGKDSSVDVFRDLLRWARWPVMAKR